MIEQASGGPSLVLLRSRVETKNLPVESVRVRAVPYCVTLTSPGSVYDQMYQVPLAYVIRLVGWQQHCNPSPLSSWLTNIHSVCSMLAHWTHHGASCLSHM